MEELENLMGIQLASLSTQSESQSQNALPASGAEQNSSDTACPEQPSIEPESEKAGAQASAKFVGKLLRCLHLV